MVPRNRGLTLAETHGMTIVLICSLDANQRALAHRLEAVAPLAAIITCRPPGPKRLPTAAERLARVARGLVGLPLRRSWFAMLDRLGRRYPDFPRSPLLSIGDVNDPRVAEAIDRIGPGLVVVSGTNLLKPPLIDAISRSARIVNLHTGISPFVKGGPNCTNWCLATRQFDRIGNSVMWIDAGIDTGNLIATERTPLDGDESLIQLHVKVMDHAHDLLCRAVERLVAGQPLPNVPQEEIGRGPVFYNREWTAAAAARAVINFLLGYRRALRRPLPPLALVNLDRP